MENRTQRFVRNGRNRLRRLRRLHLVAVVVVAVAVARVVLDESMFVRVMTSEGQRTQWILDLSQYLGFGKCPMVAESGILVRCCSSHHVVIQGQLQWIFSDVVSDVVVERCCCGVYLLFHFQPGRQAQAGQQGIRAQN